MRDEALGGGDRVWRWFCVYEGEDNLDDGDGDLVTIVVMNIPMRRGKELSEFGKMRKTVNKECIKKLREWNCDGIQLSEEVDWQEVWGRDGKHLRFRAHLWVAMIIKEWINFRNKKYTTENDVENKSQAQKQSQMRLHKHKRMECNQMEKISRGMQRT
ncbi:hypothetical protein E2C01_057229 [Portunus trituberculatus]|uniref:Uncharacterized protein n=1 Tax=Portunus trituberculatus TaxID=210409 RepID=A0A5B7H0H8_PORTR|nr:hypothetical protein [Portunus trituberculatus]